MKIEILLLILFLWVLVFYYVTNKKRVLDNPHLTEPTVAKEQVTSDDFIKNITNSAYAKNLTPLMNFVAGRKVISAKSGNAGFLLILDNGSWASAFRTGKTISYEFGSGKIDKATLQINSTIFGDATDPIKENRLYAKERNNIQNEIEKSYGKTIESLAIGINTFNFAFEDGMELDFQLCNDKNGIPSIRVFWEQW